MPNLDQVLQIISTTVWIFFNIFAIVQFVLMVWEKGIALAILDMFSMRILVPLTIALSISFVSAALVFIPPTHVGVVISLISPEGVRPEPLRSGLHLVVPLLEREIAYPTYWQTYTMSNRVGEGAKLGDDSIRARTSDGQEVRLDSSLIFRIDQEQAVLVHEDWQDRYVDDLIRPIIRGFVRTQVSQFTVREVNSSERKELEIMINRLLHEQLAGRGFTIDQFLIRDITFTDQYAQAVEAKQVALEEKEKTLHQAEQMRNLAAGERDRIQTEAMGRANAIVLEAQAQAEALKLISEALAQNPDLLTYEYINKLSPNIRAMLVPNNTPLILPLQDLVDEIKAPAPVTTTVAGPTITLENMQAPFSQDAGVRRIP